MDELKVDVKLVGDSLVISYSEAIQLQLKVVDVLQMIVDATPTDKDNAVFEMAKPALITVIAALGSK